MTRGAASVRMRTGSVAALLAGAPPAGQWLSASEQERLAGIAGARRAGQFVAGRWLARHLLAAAHGDAAPSWTLDAHPDRPPAVSGHPGIHLSIAHSGDAIACTVANVAVGVDVEAVTPRRLGDVLRAVTTPDELAALGDVDDIVAREVWTLKEAWIKCTGGELFSTMLGHRAEVRPATPDAANACTWRYPDKVVAVVLGGSTATLTADSPLPSRHWHVGTPQRVEAKPST